MHTAGCPQSLLGVSPRRACVPHPSPQEPRRRQGWPARRPPCRSAGRGGPHPAPGPPGFGAARRRPAHRGSRELDTRSTGASANARARRWTSKERRPALAHCRSSSIKTNGRCAASRPSRSAAALNARNARSRHRTASAAGRWRPAPRGGSDPAADSPPQRATWSVSSSRGRVLDTRANDGTEGLEGYARLIAATVEDRCRRHLADWANSASNMVLRIPGSPPRITHLRPDTVDAARRREGRRSATRPMKSPRWANSGGKRHDDGVRRRRLAGPNSAPSQPVRDPALGPDHLRRGFGAKLFDEQGPVVLEGAAACPPAALHWPETGSTTPLNDHGRDIAPRAPEARRRSRLPGARQSALRGVVVNGPGIDLGQPGYFTSCPLLAYDSSSAGRAPDSSTPAERRVPDPRSGRPQRRRGRTATCRRRIPRRNPCLT